MLYSISDIQYIMVLINLVGNAIKFTERGEVCISVHLQKTKHPGTLELRFDVQDTGIGIPAEKLNRLNKRKILFSATPN